MESLVALGIPFVLGGQFVLALVRDRTALVAASLASFGLLLTLYLVNFAKHSDAASQQLLKASGALIGFRYGYALVFLAVAVSALLSAFKLAAAKAGPETQDA